MDWLQARQYAVLDLGPEEVSSSCLLLQGVQILCACADSVGVLQALSKVWLLQRVLEKEWDSIVLMGSAG